eukprot:493830-Amphidinium_carterae.1
MLPMININKHNKNYNHYNSRGTLLGLRNRANESSECIKTSTTGRDAIYLYEKLHRPNADGTSPRNGTLRNLQGQKPNLQKPATYVESSKHRQHKSR